MGIFKKYLGMIPADGPFYKRPIDSNDGKMSYSSQNIGINTLSDYVKRMFHRAGINTEGREVRNHSLRVTQVTTLHDSGAIPSIFAPGRAIVAMPWMGTNGRVSSARLNFRKIWTFPTLCQKPLSTLSPKPPRCRVKGRNFRGPSNPRTRKKNVCTPALRAIPTKLSNWMYPSLLRR